MGECFANFRKYLLVLLIIFVCLLSIKADLCRDTSKFAAAKVVDKSDKPAKVEKPEKTEQVEKPEKTEKPVKTEKLVKTEKPEKNINKKLTRQPSIVIIGAGASGIAAAAKLFEEGFVNVTVLEAEKRIGGRINTIEFGGYPVDLGGQWVHGEEGNVVYEMAWPLGVLEKREADDPGIEMTFHDSYGEPLNRTWAERLQNFYFRHLFQVGHDKSGNWSSLGDYLESKFDIEFKDTPLYAERKSYLHQLELMSVSSESADSWLEISLSDNEYHECPGDQIINWKSEGYSKLFDVLTKKIPDPANELPVLNNTKLDSEVTTIYWAKRNDSSLVTVMTSKTDVYEADHVILTVSLGVLKERHASLFNPPLPVDKVKTIKGLEFGTIGKIILEFEKPFWTLKKDKRMIMMTYVWDDGNRTTYHEKVDKFWTIGTFGVSSIEHKPNLLLMWVIGRHARVMETLPEEKVFNQTVELLHKFFDKTYKVTDPIKMVRSQWYRNKHFRGTYSYRSRQTIEQNVWAEKLEEPLDSDDMRLLFAGEAANLHRFSTVDGAVGAGWQAANRIIKRYKG